MRHFPNIVGMLKTKDKRRCLGVSVVAEGQLSSHEGFSAFPVKRLSLQRGPKPLLTQTTCKFAVPQKGLFAIRSQGLLRKGDSRCLCETHSRGLKYPSSDPTPRRGLCQHHYQELTATLTCPKAAQDSLQARALWTLVHPEQSRSLLPARRMFNTSCTHLQVPPSSLHA